MLDVTLLSEAKKIEELSLFILQAWLGHLLFACQFSQDCRLESLGWVGEKPLYRWPSPRLVSTEDQQ